MTKKSITFHTFPFGKDIANNIYFKVLTYSVIPFLIIVIWHYWANHINKPYLLPTAYDTLSLFLSPNKDLLAQGSLSSNSFISLLRILIGFSCAMFIAIPLGIVLGGIAPIRQIFEPIIELIRPVCPIAWIPFIIAVFKVTSIPEFFGFSYTGTILDQLQIGMIFIIFLGGFFPLLINTLDGVSGVRESYIQLALCQGANKFQVFTKVILPCAFPQIFTGIRQGIGLCWFVIIASEMLPGTQGGIGYLLIYAADMSAMNIVLASMIIIGGIGTALNYIMVFASRKLLFWKAKEL